MNTFYQSVLHLMSLNISFDKKSLIFCHVFWFFLEKLTIHIFILHVILCIISFYLCTSSGKRNFHTGFLPQFAHFNFASTSTSTTQNMHPQLHFFRQKQFIESNGTHFFLEDILSWQYFYKKHPLFCDELYCRFLFHPLYH